MSVLRYSSTSSSYCYGPYLLFSSISRIYLSFSFLNSLNYFQFLSLLFYIESNKTRLNEYSILLLKSERNYKIRNTYSFKLKNKEISELKINFSKTSMYQHYIKFFQIEYLNNQYYNIQNSAYSVDSKQ